jgi:hypothetical protein
MLLLVTLKKRTKNYTDDKIKRNLLEKKTANNPFLLSSRGFFNIEFCVSSHTYVLSVYQRSFSVLFDNVLHMHYVFLTKNIRLSRTLFDRRFDADGYVQF